MEWISKIIEAAKSHTKFIVATFAVSIALLFFSEETLTSLKLADIVKEFGHYIGFAALISGALLTYEFSRYIWSKIKDIVSSRKQKKSLLERLNNLDPSEKSVLREFYIQKQNSLDLPLTHPVVAGLINSAVLQSIGEYERKSSVGILSSIEIPYFVRKNITFELLELPKNPTEEEIEFLKNNRPPFMRNIIDENSLFYGW